MPMRGAGSLTATLACLAALLALTALRYTPPEALPADAPAEVFSATRARKELAAILGDGAPHPMGSAANSAVRARITERLSALGYQVDTHTGPACHAPTATCGMPVNLVARLPGSKHDSGAVLLAAHYDSVPAGPGAADDSAGVAAILEIARALKHGPPLPHPVILLLDDGEEAGLLGARLFVDRHPGAGEVTAAVNLEARGTAGPSFMFETGNANRALMRLYGDAIAAPMTNSLYYSVYKRLPNDTDFTVFKAAGYQGYNFAFLDEVARYHTPGDDLAHLDLRSLQHHGDNALSLVRALAAGPLPAAAAEDAVYFDLFRTILVQWPAAAALPLSLALAAVLAAAALALVHRRQMSGRELRWGIVASLAVLAGGSVLAVGLFLALRLAGIAPTLPTTPWIAYPGPAIAAFAALAFAASSGIALLAGKRHGRCGASLGHALVVALLGTATAIALPGGSFLFLVPGAATAACFLVLLSRPPWTRDAPAAHPVLLGTLPAVASYSVTLPLLYFLHDALGAPAWPLIAAALLPGTQYLAPTLAAAAPDVRRSAFFAALLVLAGGLAATALLPTYSGDLPQRLNLEYRRDADHGRAYWVAKPDGPRLPADLAAAAPFTPREAPGGRREYFAAAPDLPLPAPELQVMETTPAARGVRFRLHLDSPRNASELTLHFPAGSAITSLQWDGAADGSALALPLRGEADGSRSVSFRSPPAGGVELSFETESLAPLTVQVTDRSYDFPAEGRFLQAARGTLGVPSREGDMRAVTRSFTLLPGR